VNVTVSEENVLLGSAGTLAANRDWIGEEKHFWVFYADVLSCIDLRKMAHFHFASRMLATIGLYHVPDPGRCGIVTLDDNHIVKEFVEKPARPTSSLAFSGVMIAMSEILELIPASRPADIGFHVLPQLVGKMAGYPISEYLIDIGTMENYCQAQETWPGGTLKDRDACSQQ
jgi:mannose-1-phosphate guanylyltransferase